MVETYEQAFTVEFRSPESARKAAVRVAGLYHDFKAAFSTRMDDNNSNDIRVAEVMARFGQKGTFFLNDPWAWWEGNADQGSAMPHEPGSEVPRGLRAGGHSIGAHTLSHDYLPALSKNAAFKEIMGSRIVLEVQSGSPVSTFTFPFMYWRSPLREGLDRTDIEEVLRRSGIVQLAEDGYNGGRDTGLQDACFIVVDGKAVGGGSGESVIDRECQRGGRPLFLVSMHAWPERWGGRGFPILEEVYRRWAGRQDWWYCNANEYAAYRHQALHTVLTTRVDGRSVRVTLARPDPLDLGDWVPLTLAFDGVGPEEVLSLSSEGAKIEASGIPGLCAVDLSHDGEFGPVAAYGRSDNPGNSDRWDDVAPFSGVRALLQRRPDHLVLHLKNDGEAPLRRIRVTFRLPLRWREGVVRRNLEALGPGSTATLKIDLSERPETDGYADGVEYDVAQVDFVGVSRARLYALCEAHREDAPAHFSREGFLVLGPVPGDLAELDPQFFGENFPVNRAGERAYTAPWGRSLSWRAVAAPLAGFLDPDIVPTSAQANTLDIHGWHSSSVHPHTRMNYLLRGMIHAPVGMTVHAVFDRTRVVRVELNGVGVSDGSLELREGANELRILYHSLLACDSQFNEGNYGCYFRLVDAKGRRAKGVRFERPKPA